MSFQHKKVLVIGATSGIGEAFAERLISEGCFVIVTGRRKENLDRFIARHGSDKAQAIAFDIAQLDRIPGFVQDITNDHPDLDCAILNAGIQRRCDWSDPESIDMETVQLEVTTNYLSYLAMTKELIPFFRGKTSETALVYISSGLAMVPSPARSNYCATKAALHQWVLSLRVSLKATKIRVIEIFPPAVQTELHDEKHQPDIKNGSQMGMPLAEFTDEAWKGLVDGKEQIPVGTAVHAFDSFELKRQELFGQLLTRMAGGK